MTARTRPPRALPPQSATERLTPGTDSTVTLKLLVIAGADTSKSLTLAPGTYRVGKDASCDLVVGDSSVSREHLRVEALEGGGVTLEDLGSTNGSHCDSVRFERVRAESGAVIRIGRVVLKLVPAFSAGGAMELSSAHHFGELLGRSVAMRRLFALAERVAKTDATVMINGETGTGKEVLARAIHQASPRAGAPLVVADLSSVTPTLVESELFGHRKGSFTGAVADRVGLIEQAHQGTLFFDEVAELPLELQPRLLRALERREVRPVGAADFKRLDFRVIAATHRDLQAEVKAGRFREDLYHRLMTVQLVLPPLRDRKEDLGLLIDAFVRLAGRAPSELSDEVRAAIAAYHLPGNVRELKNLVDRQLTLGELSGAPAFDAVAAEQHGPKAPPRPSKRPFKDAKNELVDDFERRYLDDLLERFKGNVTVAAREAGIDRVYLHRLLRKHGYSTE